MADGIKIKINTEADLAAIRQTVESINSAGASGQRANRATADAATLRRELRALEAEAAREARAQLPLEEQRNELLRQRARIQAALTAPRPAPPPPGHPSAPPPAPGRPPHPPRPRTERAELLLKLRAADLDRELAQIRRQIARDAIPSAGTLAGRLRAAFQGGLRSGLAGIGAELASAGRRISGSVFGQLTAAFGAQAGVGALQAKAREALEFADAMTDLAARMSVGIEAVQELDFAARQSGAGIESVAAAFKDVRKNTAEALAGNSLMRGSFAALGVTLEDLRTRSTDQVFRAIARELGKAPNDANRFNAALKVMGESADRLMPAFRAGFGELAQQARDAGAVLDAETLARLDQIKDRLSLLGDTLRASMGSAIVWIADQVENLMSVMRPVWAFWGALAGNLAAGNFRGALPDALQDARAELQQTEQDRANRRQDLAAREARNRQAPADGQAAQLEQVRAANRRKREELELALLSPQERRLRLLEKEKQLLAELAALPAGIDKEFKQGALLDLKKQIAGLDTKNTRGDATADELARIGGTRGPASDPAQRTRNQQLAELRRIRELQSRARRVVLEDNG